MITKSRRNQVYYTIVSVDYLLWVNEELDRMIKDVRKINMNLRKTLEKSG